jgi:hypothetical protein
MAQSRQNVLLFRACPGWRVKCNGAAQRKAAMSYALQVHFRHVLPSEGLIALAAARYESIRRVLTEPAECTVTLERESEPRALTRAVVRVHTEGNARAEASASHRDPEIALGIALDAVQEQVGAQHPWSEARTRRAS